jgi:hypothetical protein
MKAFLMYPDRDFDLQAPLPSNEPTLTQDLELETLFGAMALGDRFLHEVAKKAVFASLVDPEAIRYRQAILQDCLRNPATIRDIYRLPLEAIKNKQKNWLGFFTSYPSGILSGAIAMMEMFVGLLRQLRTLADEQAEHFESDGFRAFFTMVKTELDDRYFDRVQNHLKELAFRDGVLLSATLGPGNEGAGYILRKPQSKHRSGIKRILARKSPVYTVYVHPRDDGSARALSEIKDRGLNLVANALAQSADHVDRFFSLLRSELAFYVGCLNLYEQLTQMGEPVSFPQAEAPGQRRHSFSGLYDVCLALTMKQKVVGNDVNVDTKDLVIITGANQGGKSTFLRSIGLSQLMMQCGLFVPAQTFCANVCDGLFTHYKREEDATMESGKLDEELSRLSDIIDNLRPNSLVLFNESFAATNEREGSEIARQAILAFVEQRVNVFCVTHLYQFARGLYDQKMGNAAFLRAAREIDGARTFKIIEGEPLQTSYGQDIYSRIFGTDE